MLRRILILVGQALAVALTVVSLAFVVIRLVPGDPAKVLLGPRATPDAVAALRSDLGLDLPLWRQYLEYLGRLAHGDLGDSISQGGTAVSAIVAAALPVTVALTIGAMALSVSVGVPVGLGSAVTRSVIIDTGTRAVLVTLLATPPFFIGMVLILLFALSIPIFPAGGWVNEWPVNVSYLVLPVVTLSCYLAPLIARTVRQVASDINEQFFVEAAVARGMARRAIVVQHLLPNSLLPVITLLGLNLGGLITGAVVIESVFGLPGLGSELVQAVSSRDYPVIQGVAILSALAVVAANLLADVALTIIDPRTRTT